MDPPRSLTPLGTRRGPSDPSRLDLPHVPLRLDPPHPEPTPLWVENLDPRVCLHLDGWNVEGPSKKNTEVYETAYVLPLREKRKRGVVRPHVLANALPRISRQSFSVGGEGK